MELEYKQDFEKTRRFWDSFWKGQNTRPAVNIVIPKAGVEPVSPPPYLAGRDGNFAPIIEQALRHGDTHEFLGDAVPYFVLEWGPDSFSAYLGCELVFETGTSWAQPFIEDWDHADIRFRRDNKWWRLTEDLVHAARKRFDGRMLINAPCLVANLDSLAAMRGSEKLLLDLYDCPDKVKRALDAVCRAQQEMLAAFAELLDYDAMGSINNSGMYTSGWTTRPQCDVSCAIGPEAFREFVSPYLAREVRNAQGVEYHLDGPGAAVHVEALCEIPGIDVITWMAWAGERERTPQTPESREKVYRQIDRLGKGQGRCHPCSFDEIKRIWKEYKSRKLFFTTSARSRSEAEDFLTELEEIEKQ